MASDQCGDGAEATQEELARRHAELEGVGAFRTS